MGRVVILSPLGNHLGGLMFGRRFQPLGLGGQMTGNTLVEPMLDFCGQMNDLGRHSVVLCKYPGSKPSEPGDA